MHCSRVDAFRHRAGPIMVDRLAVGHAELGLTLTGKARSAKVEVRFCVRSRPNDRVAISVRSRPNDHGENACRAMNVIRHGLCPILDSAREAVNPDRASFAIMSASL